MIGGGALGSVQGTSTLMIMVQATRGLRLKAAASSAPPDQNKPTPQMLEEWSILQHKSIGESPYQFALAHDQG
eukprot:2700499-Amphidinium_carterae.1